MLISEWWNSLTLEQRKEHFKKARLQGNDYDKNWDKLDDIVRWSLIVSKHYEKG